jgi:subtilase family serine protease
MRNRRQRFRPDCHQFEQRCLLSGSSPVLSNGYTPAQITSAYGLNAITFTSSTGTPVKGDGAGETIALIELNSDPTLQSDLATFDAKYSLPNPTLTVVNQAGSQTDSDWTVEQSLDVEWAHAIAPGAKILVVEAAPSGSATQELQNLLNAVNIARNTASVVAVSMSWGFSEMPNESSFDSFFTTPAGHSGITFIAASGDDGTVEYPSASPNVLSVGGTTLNLSGSAAYGSETAWIDSGGGYSQYEPEPSYQQSVQQTGMRSAPDVAFDGDPNTGVEVYSTDPTSGQGSWQVVGGTSLGSPAWAGIIAIADQGRALVGASSLDGPTQTLPTLYAAASTNFNSVPASPYGHGFSSGGFDPFGGHGYSLIYGLGLGSSSSGTTTSGETANTSTGLGSPIGPSLMSDLVASTLTVPSTTGTVSASPPAKHAKKHPEQHNTHAINRAKAHASKLHERKLARQEKKAAAKHEAAHLGAITFSRIVLNASDDTLNSPRNGLSIAAVRKIKSAMKIARIATRMA